MWMTMIISPEQSSTAHAGKQDLNYKHFWFEIDVKTSLDIHIHIYGRLNIEC